LRMCYYDKSKATRDQVDAYSAPIASAGGRHALLQTARQCIPPNVDNLLIQLGKIAVPTLIIWGRNDKVIPVIGGELLHQLIPNSILEIIEECGHIPQEEKPDETVALISRFLSSTS
jgi:pimeloyl-ACP methyl ester carboxylesterase